LRWVQAYAPELNKRCRRHLKPANNSYRVDETYIKVMGSDKYLYRAVDSTGQTIDFLLTAKRDKAAAKRFLRNTIEASSNAMPRVMNVGKNPATISFNRLLKPPENLKYNFISSQYPCFIYSLQRLSTFSVSPNVFSNFSRSVSG
jgi:IS6 family transposase